MDIFKNKSSEELVAEAERINRSMQRDIRLLLLVFVIFAAMCMAVTNYFITMHQQTLSQSCMISNAEARQNFEILN